LHIPLQKKWTYSKKNRDVVMVNEE